MRITVKALPVEDIMKDLSRQWNVSLQQDSGEYSIKVPEQLGEGFVRGTSFNSGIGIIEYNCTFKKDYELLFSINKTHPLKFIFCSQGNASHTFEEDNEHHNIDSYQNVIVSSSGLNGHILSFKGNVKTHITSIEIIRGIFSHRNNYDFEGLEENLKRLFQDSVAENKFFYQGNYSMKSADIVEEINEKQYEGFLRSIFLESKILEMLVLQIEQYQDDQADESLPKILRRSDVEKVRQASDIISENMTQNLSVDYLAKEVGTNVNKLQEGFKHMYKLTVNKYMQQVKLEAAKEMLNSSDYNISEIVQQIGLTNRSYFSKIFKERYGVSPKYFLQSHQEKEEEESIGK